MNELTTPKASQTQLSPKDILQKYLPFLPWLLLSLAITLSLAFIKLRYSTPIFNVNGKLLVKDKNPYGNSAEKFSGIFTLPDDNSNINNEIEIIKSRALAARVIRSLDLQKQHLIKGKIRTSMAHPSDIPFKWNINHISDSAAGIYLTVKVINNNQFQLNDDLKTYYFNQRITIAGADMELQRLSQDVLRADPNEYVLMWQREEDMAAGLSASISAARMEGTSVINLVYATDNVKLGLNIVNQYMREYLQASFEDKKLIAQRTLQFVDSQLDTLKHELGGVERNLQDFRERNNVFAPEEQTRLFFDNLKETDDQLIKEGVRLKNVEYLSRYMSNPQNSDKLVPSILGIEEPTLLAQLSEFNQMQLKKETLLRSTQPENFMVQNLVTAIEKLRQDILENLKNVRTAQLSASSKLNERNEKANANVRSIPRKQKQLLEVTRQQEILQELYSFLLQKRLETAISSASTTSDILILEPAMTDATPVSPNRTSLYTVAFLIGLALPVGIVFLLEYLNDKVKSKADISRVTDVPVLGEVGHAEETGALIAKQNNRSYLAEQFRIIRSNLQYVLPKNEKPVILVTSSFSGEGKSFISTNLGAVLALSGKRTVIMELDIRKPKILKGLGMNERKGITNFLVSNIGIDEIIYPVNEVENLYVIPCGPVPPNPAEILLDEKLAVLFSGLKRQFDVIIIDSAPVGLVSDAITLGKFANACVYIVRHNYTLKKQVHLVDDLYDQKKLPHLSIVINDIRSKGGYGGYYGYGYGYGNVKGYSSNNYFDFNGKNRWWWPFGKK